MCLPSAYTCLHLPIVTGAVVAAVPDESIHLHPSDPSEYIGLFGTECGVVSGVMVTPMLKRIGHARYER